MARVNFQIVRKSKLEDLVRNSEGRLINEEKLRKSLGVLAYRIIARAQNAPVPRREGTLAASGTVDVTPIDETRAREVRVRLGFNTVYAAVQDLGNIGGRPLSPHPYGTPRGPNRYFSETISKNQDFVLEQMAKAIEESWQ